MGFLRDVGILIIILTVIGFLVGIFESTLLVGPLVLLYWAGLIFGLVVGVYIGYLGIAVEELQSDGGSSSYSSTLYSRVDDVERRIGRLETGGKGTTLRDQGAVSIPKKATGGYCPVCGSTTGESSNWCPNCGAPLKS